MFAEEAARLLPLPDNPAPLSEAALLSALRSVTGDRGVLTDQSDIGPYVEDWRHLYRGRTEAVVRPASTDEVARDRLDRANKDDVVIFTAVPSRR